MGSYPYPYQLITQHLRPRDDHYNNNNNRTAPTSDLPNYFSLRIEPPTHTHHAPPNSPLSTAPRLLSLDVFRGITVANLSNRTAATGKAIFRALKLLIIGVFLQDRLLWPGIQVDMSMCVWQVSMIGIGHK
nr:heparan-alpha-glucosaminide N-acetyltransferase-like isoform X3 [Ipomoea batatas]